MKSFIHLLIPLLISGCVGIYDRAEIYASQTTARVGTADVGVEFVPTQVDSSIAVTAMIFGAAESRSRGPYRIAVYAVGERGAFTHLRVQRLRLETADGRSWDMPASFLDREEFFLSSRDRHLTQATLLLAPLVQMRFDQHDSITVKADVTLRTSQGQDSSSTLTFTCARQRRKSWDSTFIPTAVVDSIRMNDVPTEHLDIGAHKQGWKPTSP